MHTANLPATVENPPYFDALLERHAVADPDANRRLETISRMGWVQYTIVSYTRP
jgi:hypothetical protein